MNALTASIQRVKTAAQYVRSNYKTYLVAAVGLAAIAAAVYIVSNLQDVETVRFGGGRRLASDIAELAIQERDPTPVLRRLSAMISK